jgi:hypothetical protein
MGGGVRRPTTSTALGLMLSRKGSQKESSPIIPCEPSAWLAAIGQDTLKGK